MQTRRTLRKVGGSVMLPIPPEILEEMKLGAGQDVVLTSEGDGMREEPSVPRPSPDAVEFMVRFTKKYDEAMRNLAMAAGALELVLIALMKGRLGYRPEGDAVPAALMR